MGRSSSSAKKRIGSKRTSGEAGQPAGSRGAGAAPGNNKGLASSTKAVAAVGSLAAAAALLAVGRFLLPGQPLAATHGGGAHNDDTSGLGPAVRYADPVPHVVRSVNFTSPRRRGGVHTVEAFAVDGFLPLDLAERWRDALLKEWESPSRGEPGSSGWVFTSNNNGTGPSAGGGNAKIRGNHDIERRRRVADQIEKEGQFAYRKWELPAGHPVLVDVLRHMQSEATLRQVARILRMPPGKRLHNEAIEIFVTQYSEGDFLSLHDDAIGNDRLPTWAFVVSLTAGPPWEPSFGGQLEYMTVDGNQPPRWGKKFSPAFNRAMFFRTSDPGGPFHRVTTVTKRAMRKGWRRFGYTGWYTEARADRTDDEIKEIIRNNLGVDLLYATEGERQQAKGGTGRS